VGTAVAVLVLVTVAVETAVLIAITSSDEEALLTAEPMAKIMEQNNMAAVKKNDILSLIYYAPTL